MEGPHLLRSYFVKPCFKRIECAKMKYLGSLFQSHQIFQQNLIHSKLYITVAAIVSQYQHMKLIFMSTARLHIV